MSNHKVFITNSFFFILFFVSYLYPQNIVFQILGFASLFALSGAITNWLAVYMLFEKVPFVIGSGVIPNQFEGFKSSIRKIILENFFKKENFQIVKSSAINFDWRKKILAKIDITDLFDTMTKDFINSDQGGIINMLGGKNFLEKFKKPFEVVASKKINDFLGKIDLEKVFSQKNDYQIFLEKVTKMLDQELSHLTPAKIKKIVSDIIKKHLSWLVVWGGLFGFLLGLASSLFYYF
jgi:uncharacterized membrane protein YheB (UPF0754 family)